MYLAILTNVDNSIAEIDLPPPLQIIPMHTEDCVSVLSRIEGIPGQKVYDVLFRGKQGSIINRDEGKIFTLQSDDHQIIIGNQEIHVDTYTARLLRLLRLYREGGIFFPLRYDIYRDGSELRSNLIRMECSNIDETLYSLNPAQIDDLRSILSNNILQFELDFLNVAEECFDASYRVYPANGPALLMSFASLEAMYKLNQREGSRVVKNRVKQLLGEGNSIVTNQIEADLNDLYIKRNKIIHDGDLGAATYEDVVNVRNYVRLSIWKIIEMAPIIKHKFVSERLTTQKEALCLIINET